MCFVQSCLVEDGHITIGRPSLKIPGKTIAGLLGTVGDVAQQGGMALLGASAPSPVTVSTEKEQNGATVTSEQEKKHLSFADRAASFGSLARSLYGISDDVETERFARVFGFLSFH